MKFTNLPWSIIPKVYLLRNRKDIIKIINESVYDDFQNYENFFQMRVKKVLSKTQARCKMSGRHKIKSHKKSTGILDSGIIIN